MKRIYDISMLIDEAMQTWKNDPDKAPVVRNLQNHSMGRPHESRIEMNVHTGTHVDAPLHMLEQGDTIETIALEQLVGPARVLDLTGVKDCIGESDLIPFDIRPGERILFKTVNSHDKCFNPGFVYLREDGAVYLADIGITLVGIDALGIERAQDGYPTHRTLMRAGVVIVEGLRLKDVSQGSYTMAAAPLKLHGIDAAPARVFLFND